MAQAQAATYNVGLLQCYFIRPSSKQGYDYQNKTYAFHDY